MIWECLRCGKEYDGIKVNGHYSELLGFITELNGELYLFCFNEDFYDEPYVLLMNDYDEYWFHCTFCGLPVDRRTTRAKEVMKHIECGFQNRRPISDLV